MRPDLNFPDRPTHPDFERLAAAARVIDAQSDEGFEVPDIIKEFLDYKTLVYLTEHRTGKFLSRTGDPTPLSVQAALINGILIGIAFQQAGGRQA